MAVHVRRGDKLNDYASEACTAPATIAKVAAARRAQLGSTSRTALVLSDERDHRWVDGVRAELGLRGFAVVWFESDVSELEHARDNYYRYLLGGELLARAAGGVLHFHPNLMAAGHAAAQLLNSTLPACVGHKHGWGGR